MTDSETKLELTLEQIQEIFPIAPSDRRQNADLFRPWIDGGTIKDDKRFYAVLATLLTEPDPEVLRQYDERMRRKGKITKQFGVRASRFLQSRSNEPMDFEELFCGTEAFFIPGTPQAIVLDFVRRLYSSYSSEEIDADQVDHPSATPPGDWQALAVDLSERAGTLSGPDPVAAGEIVALAERLLVACKEGEFTKNVRTGFAVRLDALAPALGERLPETMSAGEIDNLGLLIDRAEAAGAAYDAARGAAEALDLQFQDAIKADDYDAQENLVAERRQAAERRRATEADRNAALAALRDWLGVTGEPAEAVPAAAMPAEAPTLASVPLGNSEAGTGAVGDATTASDGPTGEKVFPDRSSTDGPTPAGAPSEDWQASDPADAGVSIQADAPAPPAPDVAAASDRPHDPQSAVPRAEFVADDRAPIDAPATKVRLSPEGALAHHLAQGDIALAWHLARIASEAGPAPPIPPAVIEALIMAPTVHGPEDLVDPHYLGVLAEMMGALPTATDLDAAATLALAALIRPALFGPDSSAREHVGNLPRRGDLAPCAGLIDALAALEYNVRVSAGDLAGLAGVERMKRVPVVTKELEEWLATTRNRKCNHQPTYRILHSVLAPRGEIGRVIEAAIDNRPGTDKDADALVLRLSGTLDREDFVAKCERRVGRPARDRIEGTALGWITARLAEAGDLLRSWLDAHRADAQPDPIDDRTWLASSLGPLRKAGSAARKTLAAPCQAGDPLRHAVRARFRAAIDDLSALLEGRDTSATAPRTRTALFEAPLLRLPSGCQDWTGGDPSMDAERAARDKRLFQVLFIPEDIARDDRTAFKRHLLSQAILPASALLKKMRSEGLKSADVRVLDQELEEASSSARANAVARIARLQQELTSLAYLDVEAAERQRSAIAQLAGIAAALTEPPQDHEIALPALDGLRTTAVPPDFPELDVLLTRLEDERDDLRARIRDTQLRALSDLCADRRVGDAARRFAEAIDWLDPVMIDDALADLRSGRAVSLPTAVDDDGFARFFPRFVETIETTQPTRGAAISAARSGDKTDSIDFSALDPAARRRSLQLLETWAKAANALRTSNSAGLCEALAELFGLFELNSVQIDVKRELIPGRLGSLQLTCDVWRSKPWYIPPAYGSGAGGHYPLLVARDMVLPDKIEAQLAEIGRDQPCLVLFFGRLGVAQRRSLAQLLRRERQQALVLDETLLFYVTAEVAPPLKTFLTAALPFGWSQPYDTSAGRAAPEMFVGRKEEIRTITAQAAGGSLIYGGRQLGKSALMDRIRQESHNPADGKMAFLIEIKPIGGPGRPASDLWAEFANALRQERAFAGIAALPDKVIGALSTWLSEKPDRRLIAMFDEADNFLRAEHAADYPNLGYLKQLIQATNWRFKASFAGLHNVRRMARAPNSPLPHLGEPICVGPMNETPENRAALRLLATEPLRAAGFDYEEPKLVGEMLARVNYYPSLVQVFGQRIIETMGRRTPAPRTGPRWCLGRDVLFEGEAAERIAEDIRNRFQWTLNLDLRYELIAKRVALQRLDLPGGDRDVLGKGMTLAEIEALVADWWPKALPQLAPDDLAELLAEMIDLGVLARYGVDRFGLRNAQVAQMLGDRDRLETDIISLVEHDEAIDYDAGLFHRSLAPELAGERAPLSDRKLEALFDHAKPGLRLVCGRPAVVGDRLATRLAAVARQWRPHSTVVTVTNRAAMRDAIEKPARPAGVVILDLPWDKAAAEWLAAQSAVIKGRVLPIWVLSDGVLPADGPAMTFRPGAWSEPMLRHWLSEEELVVYDVGETRRTLLKATGGAPARIKAIRPVLMGHAAEPLTERQRAINEWAEKNPLTPTEVGLDGHVVQSLQLIVVAGEDDLLTADEIDADCTDASCALLALDLVVSDSHGHLAPTPLGRLVAAADQ